ncbi:MAG: ATP-binding cassette domain-containing protein [Sporomusaceae bacterium]|nr:ATP-binding cassette domain-containing protein [Sporomusaceae bacterium]
MINIIDISKSFMVKKQQIQALDQVSLQVAAGDIFGVIGFSGAGKSTLLRMVNGLETPTAGRVEVDGKDINTLSFGELRQVRKRIGMVFQQFNLLNSKTVYDNIAIPLILNRADKAAIQARVAELLNFVGLSDKVNAYPSQLSGGQKQRVGIARALATNPSILLCDEATSALDPETTDSILRLLEKINRELKITVLIVTHEIHVIQRICNKVAVMEHGRVIESGSVLEVFSNPQQAITKKFVQTVVADAIPASMLLALQRDKRNYKLLRLQFLGENVTDNVLYRINKGFAVETNIVFASVNELQQTVLGIFIVQLVGSDPEIEQVFDYIRKQPLCWQEVRL